MIYGTSYTRPNTQYALPTSGTIYASGGKYGSGIRKSNVGTPYGQNQNLPFGGTQYGYGNDASSTYWAQQGGSGPVGSSNPANPSYYPAGTLRGGAIPSRGGSYAAGSGSYAPTRGTTRQSRSRTTESRSPFSEELTDFLLAHIRGEKEPFDRAQMKSQAAEAATAREAATVGRLRSAAAAGGASPTDPSYMAAVRAAAQRRGSSIQDAEGEVDIAADRAKFAGQMRAADILGRYDTLNRINQTLGSTTSGRYQDSLAGGLLPLAGTHSGSRYSREPGIGIDPETGLMREPNEYERLQDPTVALLRLLQGA